MDRNATRGSTFNFPAPIPACNCGDGVAEEENLDHDPTTSGRRKNPSFVLSLSSCSPVAKKKEKQVQMLKSFFCFLVAGLCEIGGGYLVWLWLREGKSIWYGISGAVVLVLYGVVPTFQPANFGRVYAAYGGVFIVLSILWGWRIDKVTPDRFDIIGGLISLLGVLIIMYWPRA